MQNSSGWQGEERRPSPFNKGLAEQSTTSRIRQPWLNHRLLVAVNDLRCPENLTTVGAFYQPGPWTACISRLFCLVTVWTFELDVFCRKRRFRLFLQAWVFTSFRSLYDSFRLKRGHLQALHLVSPQLLLAL